MAEHELTNAKSIVKYLKNKHGIRTNNTVLSEWQTSYAFPVVFLLNKSFTTEERIDSWVDTMREGKYSSVLDVEYKDHRAKKRSKLELTERRLEVLARGVKKIKYWSGKHNEARVFEQCKLMVEKGFTVIETIKIAKRFYKAFRKDIKMW